VRVKVKRILSSPSFAQAWRFGLRSAAESLLVVLLCPWWTWKYFLHRHRPTPALAASQPKEKTHAPVERAEIS
jgi:hypothetical protein